MGEYHVRGGRRLSGALRIGGGKNAILPILASTVLNGDLSVIHHCPLISDTFYTIQMLEAIGCEVRLQGSTITVDSRAASCHELPAELVREMRSSFIFLGGVLGRLGRVKISYPGGCALGLRPIDLHIKALKTLGVTVEEEHGFIDCRADGLRGGTVSLDFPSVGATENIMLAAVLADGETVIQNAAREPEIVDLAKFLNAMGAQVQGAGTDQVVITGVRGLHAAEHRVMPDRIVAGTFLTAAAMTGGDITLTDVVTEHLEPFLSRLEETGCRIERTPDRVSLTAPEVLQPLAQIRTQPHPGFPTDMQPQFMAMLALASGTSVISETLFESRNKHIPELLRMGADIISADSTTFIVKGVKRLTGTTVTACDLRGGAALILAGLAAEGETIVSNAGHIRRGYEDIEKALTSLGADIEFVE